MNRFSRPARAALAVVLTAFAAWLAPAAGAAVVDPVLLSTAPCLDNPAKQPFFTPWLDPAWYYAKRLIGPGVARVGNVGRLEVVAHDVGLALAAVKE